ncbi:hypothetical protein H0H81_007801, partial [Sphagnurus paluster]
LDRDLELERRKIRELQDASREREKEYQKLKALHDKFKRKALLAPSTGQEGHPSFGTQLNSGAQQKQRAFMGGNNVNIGAVVGGMEANGVCVSRAVFEKSGSSRKRCTPPKIQRTPIVNRTMPFAPQGPPTNLQQDATVGWTQQQQRQHGHFRNQSHRQPFNASADMTHSYRSATDHSDSANEVENLLVNPSGMRGPTANLGGWTSATPHQRQAQQGIQGAWNSAQKHHDADISLLHTGFSNTAIRRTTSKFRPAGVGR